jgi:CheY-like chemotaxis protein
MVSRPRILLAEDDVLLQKLYRTKFVLEGFDLQVTGDGVEALRFARTVRPDLMLLDIRMPGLDGLKVLEQIRQDPMTRGIPIVMLTNLDDNQRISQAMTLGAQGYIVKSDKTPLQVVAIVRDVLAEAALLRCRADRWPVSMVS